jgi:hypothetical protein
VVPTIGDIVTAKVTKIFMRQAIVDVLCVGSVPLNETYQGKIRCAICFIYFGDSLHA